MHAKIPKKIPKYYGLRIYLLSTLLYFFLVFPVAGILIFQYVPDFMAQNEGTIDDDTALSEQEVSTGTTEETVLIPFTDSVASQVADSSRIVIPIMGDSTALIIADGDVNTEEAENNRIGGTLEKLLELLVISFILGFLFNLPFKRYFRQKRKNKQVSEKLKNFCRKFLMRTPLLNSIILFLSYGITIIYMAYLLIFEERMDDVNRQLYFRYFAITIVSSLLTILFVYFWQKHRVHIVYLEFFFTQEELKRRIFKLKVGRIRNRLWILSAMTTLLPLLIMIFYLFISITTVNELGIPEMTEDHLNILLGKYSTIDLGLQIDNIDGLFYVNVINSLLMFVGIGTGISVAFLYLILFVKWTTEDIVYPVKELLANMQLTGRGELDNYSIVRTNDEIGELSEGFNDMSEKLGIYINNISEINRANSRFVPNQFLEFLGKKSIADINLGDQVQKEMTILFSDIRDFTGISELMTPKENFDFLNNYLGYMEPVISTNKGFIDKFIGDSIMALFPDKSEDAINAAIEMRIKLTEFNHIMEQFGKPPINSGIGIHTGTLMLGIVGGEGRMDSTVISDAVNLSSRIEGLTKVYGSSIIITEDTLIKVSDPSMYNFRFLDIVRVKGKKEAVYIFEIIDGEPDHIKDLKLSTKKDYGNAIQSYKKRDFKEALEIFKHILLININDEVVKLYIKRCKKHLQRGVPDDWDGTEYFDNKY